MVSLGPIKAAVLQILGGELKAHGPSSVLKVLTRHLQRGDEAVSAAVLSIFQALCDWEVGLSRVPSRALAAPGLDGAAEETVENLKQMVSSLEEMSVDAADDLAAPDPEEEEAAPALRSPWRRRTRCWWRPPTPPSSSPCCGTCSAPRLTSTRRWRRRCSARGTGRVRQFGWLSTNRNLFRVVTGPYIF